MKNACMSVIFTWDFAMLNIYQTFFHNSNWSWQPPIVVEMTCGKHAAYITHMKKREATAVQRINNDFVLPGNTLFGKTSKLG